MPEKEVKNIRGVSVYKTFAPTARMVATKNSKDELKLLIKQADERIKVLRELQVSLDATLDKIHKEIGEHSVNNSR